MLAILFLLRVEIKYTLSADGFKVTTNATNLMKSQPLPFFNGWHSYFSVSDESKAIVQLDPCSSWNHIDVTNNSAVFSDLIPTGLTTTLTRNDDSWHVNGRPLGGTSEAPTYLDDEFKATAPISKCPTLTTRITDGETHDTAELWQDFNFRWVQVYSGTQSAQGRSAIAVEAMSSQADSWNDMQGVNIIQAGESFVASFGVRLS